MTLDLWHEAAHGDGLADLGAPPLPKDIEALLHEAGAAPRLVAHLRLVRAVALDICGWLAESFPTIPIDRPAVAFGAATHDIGKTRHPEELSIPGHAHEEAGYAYLLEHGVDAGRARFARTHASWGEPGITVEDLVVSLADKVWKGRRVTDLEDRLVALIAKDGGAERWEVFSALDDLLTAITADADRRLAAHGAFPTV